MQSYTQNLEPQKSIDDLIHAEAMEPCWRCRGLGGVRDSYAAPAWTLCPVCDGAGELPCPSQVVELAYPDGELARIMIAE